jgi:ribulose-phosphate 3-epimerase
VERQLTINNNGEIMSKPTISASILTANFARLGEEVNAVLHAGAKMIHFDVVDNHYVPNLTVGPVVCESLRRFGIKAPIDVHLMTEPVDSLIVDFAKAGATYITFHPEASEHVDRSLQLIKDQGCKAGLAFNPATPLDYLEYEWEKLDLVLLMSVNPGFGGQKFIPTILPKIAQVRKLIDQRFTTLSPPLLEVDGGVKLDNIGAIAKAGADTFVVGSAIFNSKEKYETTITRMLETINN